MGLEAFETEGPRTYTDEDESSDSGDQNCVHILRGTDVDASMIPNDLFIHEVVRREKLKGFRNTETEDAFICSKCDITSSTLEAFLKVEKLTFKDTDWYDEFMEKALKAAEQADREETLDDFSRQERSRPEPEPEEEENDEPDSGLMSFKS